MIRTVVFLVLTVVTGRAYELPEPPALNEVVVGAVARDGDALSEAETSIETLAAVHTLSYGSSAVDAWYRGGRVFGVAEAALVYSALGEFAASLRSVGALNVERQVFVVGDEVDEVTVGRQLRRNWMGSGQQCRRAGLLPLYELRLDVLEIDTVVAWAAIKSVAIGRATSRVIGSLGDRWNTVVNGHLTTRVAFSWAPEVSSVRPSFVNRFLDASSTVSGHRSLDGRALYVQTLKGDTRRLSGPSWVVEFPNSADIEDLAEPFRTCLKRFLAALKQAGATVTITSTLRPAARNHLMVYSYAIAREGLNPASVPAMAGVEIRWAHPPAHGVSSLNASREAAERMVRGYGIVFKPALNSRHSEGRAVDLTIFWTGELVISKADGTIVRVASVPRNGDNARLQEVGASFGVIKLASDPPHWSIDGR